MNPADIKKARTESILKELIPEALSTLNDARLHGIGVLDVVCAKGRSDAKVYLDPSFFDEAEKRAILKQLRKAATPIQEYCASEQGWYRAPKLAFYFDEQLKKQQNIENLFAQIEKERKK